MAGQKVKPKAKARVATKTTLGVATPELDKESAAKEAGSQEIGAFLDWLFNERMVTLMVYDVSQDYCGYTEKVGEDLDDLRLLEAELRGADPDTVVPLAETRHPDDCRRCGGTGVLTRREDWIPAGPNNIMYWLAQYFDVDLDKAEKERRELLAAVREHNARESSG